MGGRAVFERTANAWAGARHRRNRIGANEQAIVERASEAPVKTGME